MSEWKSPLTGKDFDLKTLAEFFAEGDPRVEKDGDDYVLIGSSQAADMAAEIRRLLALLDGAARIYRPSHRPVGLHGAAPVKKMSVQWTDEAGNQHATVTPAPIEVRSKLSLARTSVDGVLTPVVPPARRAYNLALSNKHVESVLRLLGTKQLIGWEVLDKILELIEQDLGQQVNEADLATRKARKRFMMNANHQLLSGDDARHATMPGVPSPKLQMSVGDAKSWLIQVIRAWLEAKT